MQSDLLYILPPAQSESMTQGNSSTVEGQA